VNVLVKDVEELMRQECVSSSSLVAVGLAKSSFVALELPSSRLMLGMEVGCIVHIARIVGLLQDSVSLAFFESMCREDGESNLAVAVADIDGYCLAGSHTARHPAAGVMTKRIHSDLECMGCSAWSRL